MRACDSTTFTHLDPPVPVHVLDKGTGFAFAVIDYGQEHNLLWVTAIDQTGEIWCARNPRVRMQANWTMGRKKPPATESRDNGACVDTARPEPVVVAEIVKPN
ncbi:MAG: hypothetical protein OSB00_18650 [Sphingomonas bacterium]|nr:hypothetical protein [Sphingomonas bacterium]